jgi:hypothetical protein
MRGRGAIVVGCLAIGGAVWLAPACAQFTSSDAATGADGAADASDVDGANGDAALSCPAETCDGRTGCTLSTFASGTCAPFAAAGDTEVTTQDCSSGKMHIAASGTNDLLMTASAPTPTSKYRLRIAFRLSVADWDGHRALEIELAGNTLATMRIDNFAGTMKAAHCKADTSTCVGSTADFPPGTEHLFVYDIDPTTTTLSVDCVVLGSFPTLDQLTTGSNVKIQFGHPDADPFDAEIDDVLVWFTPP